MATQRTRNLRLFLSSGLTAEARANLEIIDRLADNTFIESTETIIFRAKTNIVMQPAADDLNGVPNQGTISLGTANNKALSLDFYPVSVATFHAPVKINNRLTLTTADTIDSTLTVNTSGANRSLTLGGNLSTSGALTLQTSGSATVTVLPGEQTLVNTSSVQTISNKTIDLSNNVVLTGKITNADVSASANIEYSKLNLLNSIRAVDFTTAPGNQLNYNQLNLAGSLRNSDWSDDPLHKLAGSKVDGDFADQDVVTSGTIEVRNAVNANTTGIKAPTVLPNSYNFILPSTPGVVGQALVMGATIETDEVPLTWASVGLTVLPTNSVYIGNSGTPTGVNTAVTGDVLASTATGLTLKESGVTAGAYGSSSEVAQVTVDTKGRVILAAPVTIDHDALSNFVADEHVAHSTVTIEGEANGGLTGGGDLTASRTLKVDPTVATAKALPIGADTILLADSEDSNSLKKTTLGALSSAIGVQSFKQNWTEVSASPFVITHNLGSVDTIVQVVDTANGETIQVDSVLRAANTVTVSAENKPASFTWRVLILKI